MKRRENVVPREEFHQFRRRAFRVLTGVPLGFQEYVYFLCSELAAVASGNVTRLFINLPPRHLKTFLAVVCLASYELAKRPRSKIILVGCSEQLVRESAREIRRLLRSRWFIDTYGDLLDPKHTKLNDFRTKDGGGIYAVPVNGAITGLGGDLIIFDDPLEIKHAGNLELTHKVNELYDNVLQSRFNHPSQGRLVCVGHRLHDDDPCAHMLATDEFRHIALAFIAPKPERYIIGDRVWERKKGELLRPDEFSEKAIQRLRRHPLFPLLYQQGLDEEAFPRLRDEYFLTYPLAGLPPSPRVLSIDPGQKSGLRNSYSAILVWYPHDRNTHVLVDAWRARCDFSELLDAYFRLCRLHRPSAVLIEGTALGPALISRARRREQAFDVHEIAASGQSKSERLAAVMPMIQPGCLYLLEGAEWVPDYKEEMLGFRSGSTDDWLDATTQYLPWITKNFPVKVRAPRVNSVVAPGRKW